MPQFHVERALFVVGEQNSGKSSQLRSMFRDRKLGTDGIIPSKTNLRDIYRLSNERSLYLRLASPHERGDSINEFLENVWDKIVGNTPGQGRRWNVACALQPANASGSMKLATICRRFRLWFEPERVRVAFLSPDRHGVNLQRRHMPLVPRLLAMPGVEVCWIDARERQANGLVLADFFDFS